MKNGLLNHNDKSGSAPAPDSSSPGTSAAGGEVPAIKSAPGDQAAAGAAAGKPVHDRKSTLPVTLRDKLELYVEENRADPLNSKNLSSLYNNILTPDERRFIAGACYGGADEDMKSINRMLAQILIGEKLCTVTGVMAVVEKLKSLLSPGSFMRGNDKSRQNPEAGEMEELYFPLTLRIEDQIIPAGEIPWHARSLPELTELAGRDGFLMLGDHVLASGKIISGEDSSPSFRIGDISLDRNEQGTPLLSELLLDYSLNLSVEIGRKYIPADEAGSIVPGTIIGFENRVCAPVDLVFDDYDTVIARGEVVALDEYFGIRITEFTCGGMPGILNGGKSPRKRKIDDVLFVPLRCVLGRRKVSLRDLTGIAEGSIIELDSTVFTPVDLIAGEDIRLKGEVVVMNENFGVRVVDVNRENLLTGEDSTDQDYAREGAEPGEGDDASCSVKPFAFLEPVDPRYIVSFLQGEHPQTIALVLSFLSPGLSTSVIAGMPYHLRGDIAMRIAGIKTVSSEITGDMEKILERKMSMFELKNSVSSGGVDAVVEMLNMSDRGTEKIIIEYITQNDPELAEEIRKRMFIFEDIVLLDDRSVQKVLREVDTHELVMSLKGASSEVMEKIFRNMSKRSSSLIREDMDFIGPVLLRDVENAQQKIVNIIRSLEEAGEIIIARSSEDKLVV